MQFSPVLRNKKSITIKECAEAMKSLKGKSISEFPKDIDLLEPQKMFYGAQRTNIKINGVI